MPSDVFIVYENLSNKTGLQVYEIEKNSSICNRLHACLLKPARMIEGLDTEAAIPIPNHLDCNSVEYYYFVWFQLEDASKRF